MLVPGHTLISELKLSDDFLELSCTSSTNAGGNSGLLENLRSESNNLQSFESGMTSNTTSNNYISKYNNATRTPLSILTVSLHNRHNKHNEDMEKLLIQNHREEKKVNKRNKYSFIYQTNTDKKNCRRVGGNNKRFKRRACRSCYEDNKYNKVCFLIV